jgi:hypothetical protein
VPSAVAIVLPVALAVVLAVSGAGKLAHTQDATESWRALGVPSALVRPALVRAHPWAEVLVALGLVLTGGWLQLASTVAALLLMAVYLALVVRAVRTGSDAECACFGNLGSQRVSVATVMRNSWLAVLAVASVASAASSVPSPSPIALLVDLGADAGWWAVLVAVPAVTAALVAWPGRAETPPRNDAVPDAQDDLDYVRSRTPAIPLMLGDGASAHMLELSGQRAQLVVWVSERCGTCEPVIEAVPGWRQRLPQIDIRMLVAQAPDDTRLTDAMEPTRTWHDPDHLVGRSLGMSATPSAFLLGVDGYLAGGPVTGVDQVRAFVEAVAHELEAARLAQPSPASQPG